MRWILSLVLISLASLASAAERKRILVLGDSITQAGMYVYYIDAYLFAHPANDKEFELINIGLSGETVCGLSESKSPRPNVNDRLEKALAKLKPDSVCICYGMNDGIYFPFDEKRFEAYKKGMVEGVVQRCEKAGAKVTLLTPFPFDPLPIPQKVVPKDAPEHGYGHPYEKYDEEVLRKYADWIVTLKSDTRMVVDIHKAIDDYIAEQRKTNPKFFVSIDGVHPGPKGHKEAARAVLKAYYPKDAAEVDAFLDSLDTNPARKDWFKLIEKRSKLLAESFREDSLGRKPKVSTEDALKQAAALEKEIRAKKP